MTIDRRVRELGDASSQDVKGAFVPAPHHNFVVDCRGVNPLGYLLKNKDEVALEVAISL